MNEVVNLADPGSPSTTILPCQTSSKQHQGFRGWKLTRPDGEMRILTREENVVPELEHQVGLYNEGHHFILYVPADDTAWAGVYSCFVQKTNYNHQRLACLTMIGKLCA